MNFSEVQNLYGKKAYGSPNFPIRFFSVKALVCGFDGVWAKAYGNTSICPYVAHTLLAPMALACWF